jgi:hypothetical protein
MADKELKYETIVRIENLQGGNAEQETRSAQHESSTMTPNIE